MRIKALKLKDFRPFHKTEMIPTGKDENGKEKFTENSIDIEIKFSDSNLTVFIGENGSGKTTILDALGILLTKLFITPPNKSLQPLIPKRVTKLITGISSYELRETDIYHEKGKHEVGKLTRFTKIELLTEEDNKLFSWVLQGKMAENNNYLEKTIDVDAATGLDTHYSLISAIKYNLERNQDFANLDILCFYQTNSSIYEKDRPKISLPKGFPSQLFAYKNAFSQDSYSFEEFINWFRIKEEKENKTVKEDKNLKFKEPALELIREVLREVSNSFELKLDSIRVDPNDSTLLILTKDNSKDLHLSQLSAGEQRILFLFFDIAKRIYHANPGRFYDEFSKEKDSKDILRNATGIVIIDEIDLHLHPKWQRLVVPALMATFPNVQFIVTTHSDLVITHVPTEAIIQLGEIPPRFLKEKYNYIFYGADVENAREFAMSLKEKYPKDVADKLLDLFESIKNDKEEEYKKIRDELLSIIDKDHPELIRAKNMIELKRMMKK